MRKALLLHLVTFFYLSQLFAQIPTIQNISPEKAVPGNNITITGSGFQNNINDNMVFFNSLKATITSASPTSLQVTVPYGSTYGYISVLNKISGLSSSSQKAFAPVFRSKRSISPTDITPKQDITNISNSNFVTTGDLDGDGVTDIITANYPNTVSILRNNTKDAGISNLGFADKLDLSLDGIAKKIMIEDIDGDGKNDLVILVGVNNKLSVFKNIGSAGRLDVASFGSKFDITVTGTPEDFTISDIDRDGKPDIIVSNSLENRVSIFRNVGNRNSLTISSFATPVKLVSGARPEGITAGDFNNDGKTDIIVGNSIDYNISVFEGLSTPGNISFSAKSDINKGYYYRTYAIEIADLNGDGYQDFVARSSSGISIYQNKGNTAPLNANSFSNGFELRSATSHASLNITDLDGDGKPDFLVINSVGGSLSLIRNSYVSGDLASSSFDFSVELQSGNFATSVASADLDNDGKVDIIANSQDRLSIWRNKPSLVPFISSFTPLKGQIGTTITISGENFNPDYHKNTVIFGSVKANVNSGKENQLNVTVPVGAAGAPISVINTEKQVSTISAIPFSVTFSSIGRISTSDFRPRVDAPLKDGAGATAIGDFDEDGKPDLVMSNYKKFSILRNITPNGNQKLEFEPAAEIPYTFKNSPDYFANIKIYIVDINGDGKLDIVNLTRHVLINESEGPGNIKFRLTEAPYSDEQYNTAVGDINMDGKPDIIWRDYYKRIKAERNIIEGNNPRVFDTAYEFSPTKSSNVLNLTDLDGDGQPELITENNKYYGIAIYRNISANSLINQHTFADPINFNTGKQPINISIGDINQDGKPDIIIGNQDQSITIFLSQLEQQKLTETSFQQSSYSVNHVPVRLALADIDGDGKPDIVSAGGNNSTYNISILKNNFTGNTLSPSSFSDCGVFPAPNSSPVFSMCINDMNGDGKPDIVLIGDTRSENAFSYFINDPNVYSAPLINSFSPKKAPIAATISIKGENFSKVKENNVVYFGAVRAEILNATETELSVKVPHGSTHQPISVLNTESRLKGFSALPFISTFINKEEITISDIHPFKLIRYITPDFSIADIDAEGRADIISSYYYSSSLAYTRNNSSLGKLNIDGEHNKYFNFSNSLSKSVLAIDIDMDGKADALMTDSVNNKITLLRNNSDLKEDITYDTFRDERYFESGKGPSIVGCADFDGDGKPDVITGNHSENSLSILQNTSAKETFSFKPKQDIFLKEKPLSMAIADFNGDGKPDIAVCIYNSPSLLIFKNTSTKNDISFTAAEEILIGSRSNVVKIADLNEDGKPDIVFTNPENNTFSVIQNLSTSTLSSAVFSAPINFKTGNTPIALAIDDLSGDGRPDIVTVNKVDNTISVFRNMGKTEKIDEQYFSSKIDFIAGKTPSSVYIVDLDNDEKKDILVGTFEGIAFFKNDPVIEIDKKAPHITSFFPERGAIGTTVTIKGDNFSTVVAENTVTFGSIRAVVKSASTTELEVTVPTAASYRKLNITNTKEYLTTTSTKPFNVTFDSKESITKTDFDPLQHIPLSKKISTFEVGDLDGDGLADIVITYANAAYDDNAAVFSILKNTSTSGNISFKHLSVISFPNKNDTNKIRILDLNADGKPDIIFSKYGYQNSLFYLNTTVNGNISFAQNTSLNSISILGISDIDKDGKLDIVTPGGYFDFYNHLGVHQNKSENGIMEANSFANRSIFKVVRAYNYEIEDVSLEDLDDDGKLDILFSEVFETQGSVSIFKNQSISGRVTPASLSEIIDVKPRKTLKNIRADDIDGDGKLDIIYSPFSIIKNNCTPGIINEASFEKTVNYVAGTKTEDYTINDIDGDGKLDFITGASNKTITIYRNNAKPNIIDIESFPQTQKTELKTDDIPINIASHDLDGDGKPDIVFHYPYANGDKLGIFRNNPSIQPTLTLSRPEEIYHMGTNNTPNAIVVDSALNIGYIYHQNLAEAKVEISDFKIADERLSFQTDPQTMGNIRSSFDGSTGILLLKSEGATATLTEWESALRAITYFNSNIHTNNQNKEIIFMVSDGQVSSLSVAKNIYIHSNPKITSISPAIAGAGGKVVIKGENFYKTKAVYFGGIAAKSFEINNMNQITAIVANGNSGDVNVTTINGSVSSPAFTFVEKPIITASGALYFKKGESITLSVEKQLGYNYQWFKDGNPIWGVYGSTHEITQGGIYQIGIYIDDKNIVMSDGIVAKAIYTLPQDNFQITANGVSCKELENGSIKITSQKTDNFTVRITSDESNISRTFNSSYELGNLPAGKYQVKITAENDDDFEQLYEITIASPKDLKVYATANAQSKQLVLSMDGSDEYKIELNGKVYHTNANEYQLTLSPGENALKVSTSKECQGFFVKNFVIIENVAVYPNPFDKQFKIVFSEIPVGAVNIKLSSLEGKTVKRLTLSSYQEKEILIDLENLASGQYIITISFDNKSYVQKIIKR